MKILLLLLCISLYTTSIFADEIENSLLPCIIEIESGGNQNAISPAGAIGLCQITPIVLAEYNQICKDDLTTKDLFYPDINKKICIFYLRRLKDHYIPKDKFSIELLLACYNAGPTKMKKLNWDIQKAPLETKNYIKKVLKEYYK